MTTITVEEQSQVRQETRQILKKYGRKRRNLIPILQKVQGKLGYLPREAMLEIVEFLNIPEMDVYSVVTFYKQLSRWPFHHWIINSDNVGYCRYCGEVRDFGKLQRRESKLLGLESGRRGRRPKYE